MRLSIKEVSVTPSGHEGYPLYGKRGVRIEAVTPPDGDGWVSHLTFTRIGAEQVYRLDAEHNSGPGGRGSLGVCHVWDRTCSAQVTVIGTLPHAILEQAERLERPLTEEETAWLEITWGAINAPGQLKLEM